MHVESVRSWEKSSSCLRQHTDCPSCAGLKCRLPSKRSETNKRKTRNTECLWHEGKLREGLFPWQGDPYAFFFFLLRREQICNALCYLANAEVAVWELSNWAAGMDVHTGFRWCRCSALSFSRTKLQGQNSKLLLTQTRQRSLSHALWPERISHQILLSSLIKLHQVINKKIQPW